MKLDIGKKKKAKSVKKNKLTHFFWISRSLFTVAFAYKDINKIQNIKNPNGINI